MNQTAVRYADALYELAKDEGLDEELGARLGEIDAMFREQPDYFRLLSAATLSKAEKLRALDEAFSGRVHPYLLSFLKLLCEAGHIRQLSDCALHYRARFRADRGILEVRAAAAVPLSEAQTRRLRELLSARTGQQVELELRVDPAVLGGVRLEYDGYALDGTVHRQLELLGKALSETVL